jgi:nucleoside-diphosphate-sugar epimerase
MAESDMKILLTGASGFVGAAWLARFGGDHEVITIGRGKPDSPHVSNHVTCNLAKAGELSALVASGALPAQIDAVVHLAVSRLHRDFPTSAGDLFEVNVASAAALLDYARQASANRFLLGSTGSVYDGCSDGVLNEDRPLTPKRFFPASKLAAEILAIEYRKIFPISTLRFFTPYGPGQADRLLPDLISRVRDGRALTLPETGEGMSLTTIYVDDCVAIANQAMNEAWDQTVNIASREVVSIEQLGHKIGQIMGKSPSFERRGPSPSYQLTPDLTRLSGLVNLDKLTTIDVGLGKIIAAQAQQA